MVPTWCSTDTEVMNGFSVLLFLHGVVLTLRLWMGSQCYGSYMVMYWQWGYEWVLSVMVPTWCSTDTEVMNGFSVVWFLHGVVLTLRLWMGSQCYGSYMVMYWHWGYEWVLSVMVPTWCSTDTEVMNGFSVVWFLHGVVLTLRLWMGSQCYGSYMV